MGGEKQAVLVYGPKKYELVEFKKERMVGFSKIITREHFKSLFSYVDDSEIENEINPMPWIAPSPTPDREVCPSPLYMDLLERMHICWIRNKEATTRTYIDQVLLDVLWGRRGLTRDDNRKTRCYRPFGEVWSTAPKYSGYADYILGYGDPSSNLSSFLLVVEAKSYRGDALPWQLLSIMAHYQSVRRNVQKLTYTVYGILSDSEVWRFYRLDNNSKVWVSRPYAFSSEKKSIWGFIDHIIDTSEKLSPTTTPLNSEADLFNADPAYKKYIEKFYNTPGEMFGLDDLCEGMELLFRD